MERTRTSPPWTSRSRRAASRAFWSGGLISLGTPTRLRVFVTGSTESSWAFGTCLMQTMVRRPTRAAVAPGPVTWTALP